MLLTLVRHGDALAPSDEHGDAGRQLSPVGREQVRATGWALAQRNVAPTHVWCSPLVRAKQTTALLCEALAWTGDVEVYDHLQPESSLGPLFASLAAQPDQSDVLVVGHMPFMAAAASELLGLYVSGFATAAAYRMQVTSRAPTRAKLAWRWSGRFLE
jgi:phosphohistidine phosphatase